MDIESTLVDRKSRYGEYVDVAKTSQQLKQIMIDSKNWNELKDAQRESLEMIVHKISRILNGDPNYRDSWHDIIGYAKLIESTL